MQSLNEKFNNTKSKVVDSMRELVSGAESLLQKGTECGDETPDTACSKAGRQRLNAKNLLAEIEGRYTQAIDAADQYVHNSPWKSICVVLALGIVIGLVVLPKPLRRQSAPVA
ncbi:MAG: YqjD family protein [Burkholderiaceae bacterium]|jgi:ElaB/YqjD/DUF883 family membrane-anchored ribosome-binding protein